jgi:hypothetical protein
MMSADHMLAYALRKLSDSGDDPNNIFATYDSYIHERLGKIKGEEADDLGPFSNWYMAHKDDEFEQSVFSSENGMLRLCGYVIWDHTRVADNPVFRLKLKRAKLAAEGPFGFDERSWSEMIDSLEARTNVWLDGGSGYWSKDDLSKIVWSGNKVI